MTKKVKAEQVRDLLFEYDSLYARFENLVKCEHTLKGTVNLTTLQDAYQVFFGAIRILDQQEQKLND